VTHENLLGGSGSSVTLNGPLSVRKLTPGTYLSQTGNPLGKNNSNYKSLQCYSGNSSTEPSNCA
jgi:hypothetical protein